MVEADRRSAAGEATRAGEGALVVRLQLCGSQSAPTTQTDGTSNSGRTRAAVCLKRGAVASGSTSGATTRDEHRSVNTIERILNLREALNPKKIRYRSANFNKFLETSLPSHTLQSMSVGHNPDKMWTKRDGIASTKNQHIRCDVE